MGGFLWTSFDQAGRFARRVEAGRLGLGYNTSRYGFPGATETFLSWEGCDKWFILHGELPPRRRIEILGERPLIPPR